MQSRELSYGILLAVIVLAVVGALFMQQPWLMLTAPAAAVAFSMLGTPRALLLFLWFSISWSMEVQLTPALGTDFPDEPLMWVATIMLFVMMLQQQAKLAEILSHPIMIIIGLLWCWSMVSTLASHGGWLSVKYVLAKVWYVVPFVWGTVLLFAHGDLRRNVWMLIVVPMVILALVTLARHAMVGFSFAEVSKVCTPYFRNHVNYGALLVCSLPMVWLLYKTTGNRWWIMAMLVLLTALYFSYSRGAWLALPVGIMAVWLLRKRILLPAVVAATVLVIVACGWLIRDNRYLQFRPDYASTIYHAKLDEHISATYAMKDLSTAERFYRWIAGWRMAEAHPIAGVGPNHFYPAYKSYAVEVYRTYVSDNPERSTVHNYFLLLLSEQGFPAMLLFLLLVCTLFAFAQKTYLRAASSSQRLLAQVVTAVLAMIMVLISLSDLIEADKIGSLFYACAGVLVAMTLPSHIQRVTETITQQIEG